MNSEMVAADPGRHMLSTYRHGWDGQGQAVQTPVEFREQAAGSRESLQAPQDEDAARTVELGGTEVLVAASLLRELSARLRHEAARGLISPDAEQLAALSDELVERFYTAAGLRG
jgi:hypothetical protein